MNRKKIDLANSTAVVEEWLDEFDTNKRVQFSKKITVVNKSNEPRKINQRKRHSFPIDNTLNSTDQQYNFLPILSPEKVNNQAKNVDTPSVSMTETTLYRSPINRTLSVSTITSSTIMWSRRSSFSSNTVVQRQRLPSILSSIEPSSPINISSTNKVRLSSLEFNSSLSESDRKKFDDIRQVLPDEFEKLVPTLIKLGIIIFPKKFFQNNTEEEQMTKEELIERHRFISLMKKDEENRQYRNYLEHLYGSVLPEDNIHHQHQLLRESLSFQGQLALLASYQDQIQRELNKKIKYWKIIPIQSIKTSYSEYSYSTNRSSLPTNSTTIKKKSIKSNSSTKSNTDLSLTIDENSLQILIPDHMDNQWQKKTIVHIIEQGMILLDNLRSVPSSILPNISYTEQFIQDTIYDLDKVNLVKAYKRWLLLSSILYTDDKCIL